MNRARTLPQKEREILAMDLINALVVCGNVQDAAFFLQDLLTRKEMETLSKRLGIAKMLLSGMTYYDIQIALNVSHATIAKVAVWLEEKGEGFRMICKKLPKQEEEKIEEYASDWMKYKRNHALYFWPELLLEEIIKGASKRQKERIKRVLDKLEEKSELHKQLEKYLSVTKV